MFGNLYKINNVDSLSLDRATDFVKASHTHNKCLDANMILFY